MTQTDLMVALGLLIATTATALALGLVPAPA